MNSAKQCMNSAKTVHEQWTHVRLLFTRRKKKKKEKKRGRKRGRGKRGMQTVPKTTLHGRYHWSRSFSSLTKQIWSWEFLWVLGDLLIALLGLLLRRVYLRLAALINWLYQVLWTLLQVAPIWRIIGNFGGVCGSSGFLIKSSCSCGGPVMMRCQLWTICIGSILLLLTGVTSAKNTLRTLCMLFGCARIFQVLGCL